MAYDESLAERVRDLLAYNGDVSERKMFGGIAWMLNGNMACGVHGEELIVRLGPEDGARALAEPHTRAFDFTGKPIKGFVLVDAEATGDEAGLAAWVESGIGFAASLPSK